MAVLHLIFSASPQNASRVWPRCHGNAQAAVGLAIGPRLGVQCLENVADEELVMAEVVAPLLHLQEHAERAANRNVCVCV